jgi:YggT family protein
MAAIINLIVTIITLILFLHVILSWVVPPYNNLRMAVGRIVEPFAAPIRRLVPPLGGFDFSVFILMILVQLVGNVLVILVNR